MYYEYGFTGSDRYVKEWINKTETGTGSQQYFFDEDGHGKQYFLFQFHKTVIGSMMRKKEFQMFVDNIFLVIMHEAAETVRMERNKNNHNLSITHAIGLVVMFLFIVFNHVFFLL